jgi:hypothetical protein
VAWLVLANSMRHWPQLSRRARPRNRSTCGVRPYIRATCNPDADSWVADFLSWWIDPASGRPIPQRAGVLRYFVRIAEKIVWADRPEELMEDLLRGQELPPGIDPRCR